MPWYGWLVLFLFLVFVPTIQKEIKQRFFPDAPRKKEAGKDIIERKE